jgi:hypothetical protein
VADLKAVSQNLMHSSLQVTDSIYSVLSGEDVKTRIGSLGDGGVTDGQLSELSSLTERLNELLEGMA